MPPAPTTAACASSDTSRSSSATSRTPPSLRVLSNFSISFSVISVLTGVTRSTTPASPSAAPPPWRSAGSSPVPSPWPSGSPWPRSAPPSPPPAASTIGARASPATVGRRSPPGSPDVISRRGKPPADVREQPFARRRPAPGLLRFDPLQTPWPRRAAKIWMAINSRDPIQGLICKYLDPD
uniref:Uncharacterized protein n=1 Tax=Setaria viridis TaxID=4556 RepID=A0A4U6TD34_SETVI|nr:hypothetical protein SEVIR_8G081501v2 [Setaria viridis]